MRVMATTEQELSIVSLTPGAAAKIRDLMAEEPEGEAAVLRIAVQGGGCSGFQYALGFDRGPQEGDNEVESHGIPVVVDPFSAPPTARGVGVKAFGTIYRYWITLVWLAVVVQTAFAAYGGFYAADKLGDQPGPDEAKRINEKVFDHGFGVHTGLGYIIFVGAV